MPHDTTLITTLVMGLVLAFAGGFIASRLKLPPLVGYLAAGVAVGPFTPGFVGDAALAGQLAEIGVILLMFGVGLHFSIKDLMAVRRIAIPGAVAQIAVAAGLGAGLTWLWGWPIGAGIIFGLALSVASTVVLLRAMEERGALTSINGRIAVGWLIVEDLAMVLALVLLPALAGVLGGGPASAVGWIGGGDVGITLLLTLGKVALFLALMLVVGKRLVPWVLERIARTGSRELFTLSVLATALGIAYGSAALFGVSFALGAFFAGAVLSESDFSHQAAADSLPLQDAFAVLFFVSVGMLFNPAILVHEPLSVLAVLAIILIGKSIAAFGIVLAFGYPVRTALTVSASLAQIGEFSFILIGLGVTLGMVPSSGQDFIIAAAVLSIALNPLVFWSFDRLEHWLGRHPGLLAGMERSSGDNSLHLTEAESIGAPGRHAVVIGYGRIGRIVVKLLKEQNLPVIVVDKDRRRVEALRERGIPAIYGDGSTPGILEAAGIATARLLVIATPEGFQTRRIIELARLLNPEIDTAIRTHSDAEVAYLESQEVGLAIMGSRELSFGLADYALRSLGVSQDKARSIIQKERVSGEGGAFERRPDIPARHAPELRVHRAEGGGEE
ncbi:YbaL family putative K(+) efflux transporter [Sphingosinicella microcystinivorans]|uniref:YbaL family putative K(+) efflux transporter n=1 Tax=Sphingosinicella microcystinivorans TaxID=335406 RepID=UPI0022F3C774|nr:YbaL family putative K(+) efflux transporter [Sphingosinicella microcystinivorans]WBX84577.1 YbaL family putative K(+) efflux transporter [Sphingosinicella microcystinivorans]